MNHFKNTMIAISLALAALTGTTSLAAETTQSQVVMAPININQATAEQLAEKLYGIGLSKAQAIVSYREEHGPFTQIEQLSQVKGIGAAIIDRNRAFMSL